MLQNRITEPWSDYELLDFGKGRKLERFGKYITDRPEPFALSNPFHQKKKWDELADFKFISGKGSKGTWIKKSEPKNWQIKTQNGVVVQLQLSQFKHVGIFPEQAINWSFLNQLGNSEELKALNLFAYTGVASLELSATAQQVTHVESLKPIIQMAKENGLANALENIRWIQDDAFKFVSRELKRKNRYDIIVLDPPSFGRGAKGEVWKIEENLADLMQEIKGIAHKNTTILLNTYSKKLPENQLSNILEKFWKPNSFIISNLGIHCAKKNENLILGQTTIIKQN